MNQPLDSGHRDSLTSLSFDSDDAGRLRAERSALQDKAEALREALDAAIESRRANERDLAEARRQLLSLIARNEALAQELVNLQTSASWRVTAPLRRWRKAVREGRLRPRRVLRAVVVRSMRIVLRLAILRESARFVVRRFPVLRDRLRNLATHAGLVQQSSASAMPHGPSSYLSRGSLSPKANGVLQELLIAMGKANH
ncbi:hypothetical protein P3W33_05510 [Luteibacter sp. PPL552]